MVCNQSAQTASPDGRNTTEARGDLFGETIVYVYKNVEYQHVCLFRTSASKVTSLVQPSHPVAAREIR